MKSIHTSDPPNPLGNEPGLGPKIPVEDAAPAAQPFILDVPRSWTRLVIAVVTLLFLVTVLVSFMVYLNWRSAQINTQRIIEIEKRLGRIEGREQ